MQGKNQPRKSVLKNVERSRMQGCEDEGEREGCHSYVVAKNSHCWCGLWRQRRLGSNPDPPPGSCPVTLGKWLNLSGLQCSCLGIRESQHLPWQGVSGA